jgi:hypothetical protein
MRNLQECGVVADINPHFAVAVFKFEESPRITLEIQFMTLFVVDILSFDFYNGIRLVVIVSLLVEIDVDKTFNFFERALLHLKLSEELEGED